MKFLRATAHSLTFMYTFPSGCSVRNSCEISPCNGTQSDFYVHVSQWLFSKNSCEVSPRNSTLSDLYVHVSQWLFPKNIVFSSSLFIIFSSSIKRYTECSPRRLFFSLLLSATKCCPGLLPDMDQPDSSLHHGEPQ